MPITSGVSEKGRWRTRRTSWRASRRTEALRVHGLLHSERARGLLNALALWDSKRPVTAGLLGRLDLLAVAPKVGRRDALLSFLDGGSRDGRQMELL